MGYDKSKDHVMWQSDISETGLAVRVMKYGDKGKPKIAFVVMYEDFEGEPKEKNAGRLFIEDVKFFGAVWPEAQKIMNKIINDPLLQPEYEKEDDENTIYPDEVDSDDENTIYPNDQ